MTNYYTVTYDLWAACRWIDSINGGRGRACPINDEQIIFAKSAKWDGKMGYAKPGDVLTKDILGNVYCQ